METSSVDVGGEVVSGGAADLGKDPVSLVIKNKHSNPKKVGRIYSKSDCEIGQDASL